MAPKFWCSGRFVTSSVVKTARSDSDVLSLRENPTRGRAVLGCVATHPTRMRVFGFAVRSGFGAAVFCRVRVVFFLFFFVVLKFGPGRVGDCTSNVI